ncbi:MAG: hypothetical protein ACYCX3_15110 [Thermoleophilia bacterium]
MNSRLALKGVALIATGALGLVALGALGPVFNPGTAAANDPAPSWQQQVTTQPPATGDATTDGTTDDAFRDRITEMMSDHMGITGEQADEWAGTMADMMRSMHGDQADEMLNYCDENGGSGGMMGGGSGGMMGGGSGGMMGGGSGGMMGGGSGGMMGGWGTN